jgi:putative cardiolipin synthase
MQIQTARWVALRTGIAGLLALLAAACATVPPGEDFPRVESTALAHPEQTALGKILEPRAKAHGGLSGFRLFASGSDAFTLRVQLAERAQRTLDVQYFIFNDDDTGQLLMSSILHAASRGVRVRVLMDDTQARGKDDRVGLLAANPNVEVRLYNPFYYRGPVPLIRYAEFALSMSRLDYRMHNKLFVVDNELAIVGGRNVGDEYFDTGDAPQFGDYDVLAMGPIVRQLSKSFDGYWNDRLSIPVRALLDGDVATAHKYASLSKDLSEHKEEMRTSDEERAVRSGEPLASILAKGTGVVWANAEVLVDSPDKASVEGGDEIGALFRRRLLEATRDVKRELLIVSPYFVPGEQGERLLLDLAARGVSVRILTNSLLSTDVVAVHAGYRRYREPLLAGGVQLYEVKPLPGKPQPRNGALKEPSSGQFSLHAKAWVFDEKRTFIGSANFDRRSLHLNTEIGLMIDSPEIAKQVVMRFNTIASPANSFVLGLEGSGDARRLVWKSVKDGKPIVYQDEPGDDPKREFLVDLFGALPIEDQL